MKKFIGIIFLTAVVGFVTTDSFVFATGFDIRTSSVIVQPDVEILGYRKGSWYVIGFDKPGNLNKPPQYKFFKYAEGFKTGFSSPLYKSFGEKTYYLQSAIAQNRISMFYARCEKRKDEETMMETRPDRKQLPVIMRQDFDLDSLTPVGESKVIFDETDEYFACSGINIAESNDKSKTVLLLKPYYKQYKYKVILTDNNSGEFFSKSFDFKEMKTYLQFFDVKVTNGGAVFITAKMRDDVITLSQTSNGKTQNTYYVFCITASGEMKEPLKIESPEGGKQYLADPKMEMLNSEEAIVAFDFFNDAVRKSYQGTSFYRFDANLALTGRHDVTPDTKLIPRATTYRYFKKGKEFTNVESMQILPLEGRNFMLIAEYKDTSANPDKTSPQIIERGYMITLRIDENLGSVAQHFIMKKQLSATVNYGFSAKAFRKGNDVFLFHNNDWESDDEHEMELGCTVLKADGSEPVKQKIVNTSNDFFCNMNLVFSSATNKIVLTEQKIVDYENITREVKLLEITVK